MDACLYLKGLPAVHFNFLTSRNICTCFGACQKEEGLLMFRNGPGVKVLTEFRHLLKTVVCCSLLSLNPAVDILIRRPNVFRNAIISS